MCGKVQGSWPSDQCFCLVESEQLGPPAKFRVKSGMKYSLEDAKLGKLR